MVREREREKERKRETKRPTCKLDHRVDLVNAAGQPPFADHLRGYALRLTTKSKEKKQHMRHSRATKKKEVELVKLSFLFVIFSLTYPLR